MVNFGTSIVPIIAAFIGVTVGPILASAISVLTSHNPIVQYVITPNYNHNSSKALIKVTNNGSAPATNVSLTIRSPKYINKIIIDNHTLSAASISVSQLPNNSFLGVPSPIDNRLMLDTPDMINPASFLQINMPKLVHGEGSLTQLQILNNGISTHYNNYSGVVIYDQGSNLAKVEGLTEPNLVDRINAGLNLKLPYLILLFSYFGGGLNFFIIYSISYLLFIYLFTLWFYPRKRRRGFMIQIRDRILLIHHSLNEDPVSRITFDEFTEQWGEKVYYYKIYWYITKKYHLKDISKYISAKDYIYIDKLYIKLRNRKKSGLTDDELIKYNNDCARLAEDALIKIPWKNYI